MHLVSRALLTGDTSGMDEIELLRGVLAGTGDLIEGVGDDQWDLPTPCPTTT